MYHYLRPRLTKPMVVDGSVRHYPVLSDLEEQLLDRLLLKVRKDFVDVSERGGERGLSGKLSDEQKMASIKLNEVHQIMALHQMANVKKIASSMCFTQTGKQQMLPDLIQEGYFGLMEAIKSYQPVEGGRFSAYARAFIRKYCYNFFHTQKYLVSVPTSTVSSFKRTERMAAEDFSKGKPRDAYLERMSTRVKIQQLLDIDADTGDEQSVAELRVYQGVLDLKGGNDILADESLAVLETGHRLREVVDGLDDRDQLIVKRRYMADEPVLMANLCKELGLSPKAVDLNRMMIFKEIRRRLALFDFIRYPVSDALCG